MKTHAASPGAFTLIELLAVVAVVGILIGITIPVVSHARAGARSAECMSNMRQLGVGVGLYLADNKGVLPPYKVTTDADGNPLANWPGWYSSNILGQYFPMQKADNDVGNVRRRVPWCPEIESDPIFTSYAATGYGYNANLSAKRIPPSINPAKTVMFWEDVQKDSSGYSNYYGGTPSATGGAWYKFAFRHNNTGHLLLVDGHVETIKPGPTGKTADYPQYTWKP